MEDLVVGNIALFLWCSSISTRAAEHIDDTTVPSEAISCSYVESVSDVHTSSCTDRVKESCSCSCSCDRLITSLLEDWWTD